MIPSAEPKQGWKMVGVAVHTRLPGRSIVEEPRAGQFLLEEGGTAGLMSDTSRCPYGIWNGNSFIDT